MRDILIGNCWLINTDCHELADHLPKDDVAIISDPPSGINFRHSGHGSPVTNQPKSPYRRQTDAIEGDSKPFDPTPWLNWAEVILWGANHYANLLPCATWLVWDKRVGMKSNTFSDCEMAWCRNGKRAARLCRYLWNGICQAGEKHEKRYQPMQKPIFLMEWCIGMTKAPIIIDPYMGSGSTGLAALRQGRSFIGIEIKPEYFDNAVRRVETQQDLVGSG